MEEIVLLLFIVFYFDTIGLTENCRYSSSCTSSLALLRFRRAQRDGRLSKRNITLAQQR